MSDVGTEAPVARETAGARFQKLFRTTAFKLSLAYLAIFALCAFLALGYVAWNARAVLDDQIVSTIDAEINGLSEQYNAGGLRRLISVVERRSREPGASLYLVTTAGGDHVVGNVGYVPAAVLATPGQSETRYGRNDADSEAHQAIVRVFTLPGGFRLLVGRDTEERDRLLQVPVRRLPVPSEPHPLVDEQFGVGGAFDIRGRQEGVPGLLERGVGHLVVAIDEREGSGVRNEEPRPLGVVFWRQLERGLVEAGRRWECEKPHGTVARAVQCPAGVLLELAQCDARRPGQLEGRRVVMRDQVRMVVGTAEGLDPFGGESVLLGPLHARL